jgi:hypothetical protein
MVINKTYITLVKKATTVPRGTLLTLVNQEDRGNTTNIGRVEKFVVNPIPYDGSKYVPKHVGHMCVCVCVYNQLILCLVVKRID